MRVRRSRCGTNWPGSLANLAPWLVILKVSQVVLPGSSYAEKRGSMINVTGRLQRLNKAVTDGWIAMMQHYFVSAWVPPRGQSDTFYTNVLADSRYIIGKYSPAASLAPGATHSFDDGLYIGPKTPEPLAAIAPGLELTVDYGMLAIIAQPIHWLLSKIYSVVGNWGWSIIILTILIKAVFYPLSETSYKSMAHMRQVTPRMQALKDRYGDDKERLNQAMMELYKKEKINPLGGCLPIVIQIPVFIALYWVLLESVELRQAPFAEGVADRGVGRPLVRHGYRLAGRRLAGLGHLRDDPGGRLGDVLELLGVAADALGRGEGHPGIGHGVHVLQEDALLALEVPRQDALVRDLGRERSDG